MKALTNDGFPRCTDRRIRCFANDMGRCICLNDTTFRGGKCPFYKTGPMDLTEIRINTFKADEIYYDLRERNEKVLGTESA